MDCLVLPIQSRVEEWKKITNILDKEHHKGNHEVLRFYLSISPTIKILLLIVPSIIWSVIFSYLFQTTRNQEQISRKSLNK